MNSINLITREGWSLLWINNGKFPGSHEAHFNNCLIAREGWSMPGDEFRQPFYTPTALSKQKAVGVVKMYRVLHLLQP